MAQRRDPSHPPSDPRPTFGHGAVLGHAVEDRSVRAQLAVALAVGLVLVAAGLYLWRRPHAPVDAATPEPAPESPSAAGEIVGPPAVPADAGKASPVTLSDARVLACHDRGPKKTPVDQCDHVLPLEKALANAVEQAATCMPESGGGGTIEYVADVSFLRHKVSVVLPRAGRSVRDRKSLDACGTAVRSVMHSVPLDGLEHQHARYKISLTATYRRSAPGG
jgi:hypothetical protein